ncbi:hypothetical protein [Alloactinosynnema sp. L-07]|nr:hypothetical protein [Alloactinosynnema sp. L-07]
MTNATSDRNFRALGAEFTARRRDNALTGRTVGTNCRSSTRESGPGIRPQTYTFQVTAKRVSVGPNTLCTR